MARYFFDFFDGATVERDDIGIDFGRLEQARKAAATAIGEAVRESLPKSSRRTVVIKVRNSAGAYVHECVVDYVSRDIKNGPLN